ncbi:MAG: cation:proton antiporter [Candidatus Omnitrophica bacterium]|nr:cation:proton antiporter [Candidatus Omnitrophota bacterium]
MNTVLGLGFILLAGFFLAKLLGKIKFPSVTAYLLLGILIGPSVGSFLPSDLLNASALISNIVLGVIAFGIGQNFSLQNFSRIGKSVLWISVLEATGAWIFVTVAFLLILHQPFYIALVFGAIASATAPAATVMVIREFRSKGNFTDTLLGVVAIDDAWCLIIFAVSLAVAQAIYNHMLAGFFLFKVFSASLLTILGAFVLGAIVAALLSSLSKFLRSQAELLILTIGFVFLTIGLALRFHLSVLLSNMFFGAVLINIDKTPLKFFESLKTIDPPLFLLFFVLAGANLEISILPKLGLIGITYLISRVLGKMCGAGVGAHFARAQRNIKKYLGLALIPQAGVALGCALIAKNDFPDVGNMIFTTIIATTVIYEIIGPLCTKYALHKAGDVALQSSSP